MSEQINKVLASTAQAFSTAEQKQARDNINAQIAGDYAFNSSLSSKLDASASSQFITSTAGLQPSGDYAFNSSISSKLDASASSLFQPSGNYLTSVSHSANLTGDGTTGNPLGLSSTLELVYNGNTATISPYHVTLSGTAYSAEYGQYASIWCTTSESATAGAGMFRTQDSSADTRIYSNRMEIDEGDFGMKADASSVYVNQRNGGADGALLTLSSLTITSNTHPMSQLTKTGLYLYDNYGNPDSNVQTKYSTYGITWESPLPGNNWVVATANANGMKNIWTDMSAYTADYVASYFAMSHSGGNTISASVGTGNQQFGLFLQQGTASAKFGVTDIQKWNDCISSVSAGYGLKGDGVTTALSVSGLAYDESSIYQTSTNHISSNIEMTLDDHRSAVYSTNGVRITETGAAPNHSGLAELGSDHLNLHDYTISAQTYVTPSGVLLSDSATAVTIAASSWASLTAWATSQGWSP